jgi:hypothetical protein
MSEIVNLLKPADSVDSTTEFYTVEATGESGMSQTGLAILAGVSRQTIIALEEALVGKSPSKTLEPFIGKALILVSSNESTVLVALLSANPLPPY